MKCIRCGVWTEVIETRAGPNWTNRRTRLCANGHRFSTYEVVSPALASKRDLQGAARTIEARVHRWKRDLQIVKDPRPAAEVARAHGITAANVRIIRNNFKKSAALASTTRGVFKRRGLTTP